MLAEIISSIRLNYQLITHSAIGDPYSLRAAVGLYITCAYVIIIQHNIPLCDER